MTDEYRPHVLSHLDRQRQFEGVSDPADMGTTGLMAWTIDGPGGLKRDWYRARRATSVIHRRGLSVEAFSRAVLSDITNNWYRNRFAGYFASILRRYQ
jgi:hypothetical protein